MKKLVRNSIMAAILGCAFLSSGFLPVSTNNLDLKDTDKPIKIYLSETPASETERKEFWRKFRESVTPREKNPEKYPEPPPAARYKPPPKEVHPQEVHPKEVHPQEVN